MLVAHARRHAFSVKAPPVHMFVLSKIFWLVMNPANLFAFFLVVGTVLLFTRHRRAGRLIVSATVAVFVLLGLVPVGFWMTTNLENRFPANPPISADIGGIIALGGTINQYITTARKQPALTDGGERLTEFVHLARRFPGAKLIFTGGSGALIDSRLKEADSARLFFNQMGLSDRQIIYEDRSRNTHENAVLSKKLVGEEANRQKWVLITSARHMPRAMGVFRQAGWDVMAYPVDYQTAGLGRLDVGFRPLKGLSSLNDALREWIGLIVYRVLGRTPSLVPSPQSGTDN